VNSPQPPPQPPLQPLPRFLRLQRTSPDRDDMPAERTEFRLDLSPHFSFSFCSDLLRRTPTSFQTGFPPIFRRHHSRRVSGPRFSAATTPAASWAAGSRRNVQARARNSRRRRRRFVKTDARGLRDSNGFRRTHASGFPPLTTPTTSASGPRPFSFSSPFVTPARSGSSRIAGRVPAGPHPGGSHTHRRAHRRGARSLRHAGKRGRYPLPRSNKPRCI